MAATRPPASGATRQTTTAWTGEFVLAWQTSMEGCSGDQSQMRQLACFVWEAWRRQLSGGVTRQVQRHCRRGREELFLEP